MSSTNTATSTPNTGGVPVGILDGQVKWFNNHLTYGFITVVSEGEFKGTDVFVHQSKIKAGGYRTLRIGEYVTFQMVRNEEGAQHPYHAADVSGIHGGKLMCEIPRPNFNGGSVGNSSGHVSHHQHQFQRRVNNNTAGGNDSTVGDGSDGNTSFQQRGNRGVFRGGRGGGFRGGRGGSRQ
jgi:CspA family cold shock protein